jgi:hypothetical protein
MASTPALETTTEWICSAPLWSNIYPTSLDMHSGGLNYHGVYGSINSWIPRTTLEPFVPVKAMPRVLSQQNIVGTETEVTPGLRVQGLPGWKVDYDVTGTLQRGSYSNDSIHASSLLAKAGYMAAFLPWKPHLLGEYDYATGNAHRDSQRLVPSISSIPATTMLLDLLTYLVFKTSSNTASIWIWNPIQN